MVPPSTIGEIGFVLSDRRFYTQNVFDTSKDRRWQSASRLTSGVAVGIEITAESKVHPSKTRKTATRGHTKKGSKSLTCNTA